MIHSLNYFNKKYEYGKNIFLYERFPEKFEFDNAHVPHAKLVDCDR